MSDRGVFAVDRGIWCDPDFADGEFSEREAFIWLVGQAAWKPMRIRVGSAAVDLARGQCAFSTRFLAEKWQWSEARVRRYLGRLISREIICATADKKATHITILKYDRFQRVSLPEIDVPTQTRRTSDAPATHQRRKEEDIKNTQDIQDISSLRSEGARPAPSPRRTKVKPDWALGEAELSAASKAGVEAPRAAAIWPQFIDYHAAKGTIFSDWLAAWRTWCRNDAKFTPRDRPPRPPDGPRQKRRTAADFYADLALGRDLGDHDEQRSEPQAGQLRLVAGGRY
jgi:hypothetical protein